MKKLIAITFLLLPTFAYAQTETNKPAEFDYYYDLISDLAEKNEEETDFNELADALFELWESPIDINNSQREELSRLFWLTEFQANSLFDYVYLHKPIVTIYELALIPGFDTTLASSLKPFLAFGNLIPNNYKKVNRVIQTLLLRTGRVLEKQVGYQEDKFEGNPWKTNLRYKLQVDNKFAAGITLEKDAGEAFFKGSNKAGPDFYSGYLALNNLGRFKNICIGHYTLGFGQGLLMGPGFAMGKSSQTVNTIQKETSIRPSSSTDENRYFQGLASTISFSPVELTFFLSYKKRDANITETNSSGNAVQVSSLQSTGYHATTSEIADEKVLGEYTGGMRIAYNTPRIKTGISFVHSQFDAAIVPTPSNYNQFYFNGNQHSNLGIDYKILWGNALLFGEEAMDINGNAALINGITTNLSGRLQFLGVHRYYSKAYHSFYGNAFGENSRVQNEEGIYAGFKLVLIKHWSFSTYADFYHFPWLKDGVDAPSSGRDFLLQADYASGNPFSGYFQVRFRQKQKNQLSTDGIFNTLANTNANRFRVHLRYAVNNQFLIQTRVETNFVKTENTSTLNGYMAYQDIRYAAQRWPFSIYLRYAVFDAKDYDARIYAFENDVLYAFTSYVCYKQGQRYYVMTKFGLLDRLDFWIKYSQSMYPHEQSLSSGNYQINGNTRSDIRFQVIYSF